MIAIFQAAAEVQNFIENHGWRACFIGGIAVQRWSQARVPRDVDLTLLTGFGTETPFIEALLADYTPRIANAAEFALRSRVLLVIRQAALALIFPSVLSPSRTS